jgi:hypothetical protein
MKFTCFLLTCVTGSFLSLAAQAETLPATHPTAAVVKKYLESVVKQDWETAGNMLLPTSLERRKEQMILSIKNSETMTIEAAKLNMLGIKDIKELQKMSPQQAYVVDRKAVHERVKLTEEVLKKKQETLKINILGLIPEDDAKIVHALVRTNQETLDAKIDELLLISVVQDKADAKKWLVAPDMQNPVTTPLKAAEEKKEEKK